MQQVPGLDAWVKKDKEEGPNVDFLSLWTKEPVTSTEASEWPVWKTSLRRRNPQEGPHHHLQQHLAPLHHALPPHLLPRVRPSVLKAIFLHPPPFAFPWQHSHAIFSTHAHACVPRFCLLAAVFTASPRL